MLHILIGSTPCVTRYNLITEQLKLRWLFNIMIQHFCPLRPSFVFSAVHKRELFMTAVLSGACFCLIWLFGQISTEPLWCCQSSLPGDLWCNDLYACVSSVNSETSLSLNFTNLLFQWEHLIVKCLNISPFLSSKKYWWPLLLHCALWR